MVLLKIAWQCLKVGEFHLLLPVSLGHVLSPTYFKPKGQDTQCATPTTLQEIIWVIMYSIRPAGLENEETIFRHATNFKRSLNHHPWLSIQSSVWMCPNIVAKYQQVSYFFQPSILMFRLLSFRKVVKLSNSFTGVRRSKYTSHQVQI